LTNILTALTVSRPRDAKELRVVWAKDTFMRQDEGLREVGVREGWRIGGQGEAEGAGV